MIQSDFTEILELCRKWSWTLGFAESCTGGLLSSELVKLAGISDVYLGSVVSYSYPAKVDILGVALETLKSEGAVSEKVACEMARGANSVFQAHWTVAITGIAGPSGGLPGKPVGTVWFAVSGLSLANTAEQAGGAGQAAGGIKMSGKVANRKSLNFLEARKRIFSGGREQVQSQSAVFAAQFLLESMRKVAES